VVIVMHGNDGCDRVTRSANDGDLSSGESEFLRRENQRKVRNGCSGRLPLPSIGRRRVGRWCRGGETINDKWSYSMLPFERGEKGQHPF
jgi:hypothetical protein